MGKGKAKQSDLSERAALFKYALGFQDLNENQCRDIADLAYIKRFNKGETIFDHNESCGFFYMVARGLVKVSISSSSGLRITYLLAGQGDPLNLVGAFTGLPRPIAAQAMEETDILLIAEKDFRTFVFNHPDVVISMIKILGQAIDSSNSRIIDMLEKRVDQRLSRVLFTLYKKFGKTLKLTNSELAELTGTTTESTIRAMGQLRDLGLVQSSRGVAVIIDPDRLEHLGGETFWV